jgi:hypothetical protein
MSIEKALADLTAAVTAQTALMTSLAGKAGAATTGAAGAATGGKPASTKAAETPKAKTIEDVRVAASAWLGVEDPAARATAKAQMKTIIDHFGIEKATAVSAEQIPEMLAYIAAYQKGEKPDFMNEADAGGDMV